MENCESRLPYRELCVVYGVHYAPKTYDSNLQLALWFGFELHIVSILQTKKKKKGKRKKERGQWKDLELKKALE